MARNADSGGTFSELFFLRQAEEAPAADSSRKEMTGRRAEPANRHRTMSLPALSDCILAYRDASAINLLKQVP